MYVSGLSEKYKDLPYDIKRTNGKKDKDYFRSNIIGMYSIHVKDRCGITFTEQLNYDLLRSYGAGKQSEQKYKDYMSTARPTNEATTPATTALDGPGGFTQAKETQRKGYMNILWKVISPAAKLLATLLGKFEQAEYQIVASPIDAQSGAEVENKMLELWAMKEEMSFLKTYMQAIGIDMKEPDYMPDTLEELRLYRDRGGFKAEHATLMETLINWTSKTSHLKEIKKECIADLINLSVCVVKDYYDKEDGTVKTKYIDPKMFSIQYSKHSDFRDSEYGGHAELMTVSELRIAMQQEGISPYVYEQQLQKCSQAYSGKLGNPGLEQWDVNNSQIESGGWKYDFYKVLVYNAEWIDTDELTDILRTNSYNKLKIIPVQEGEKIKEKPNQKVQITQIRKRFKCKWIIGTEIIFEYGIDQNITRPNKKDVLISYHAYKLPFASITDQLIPIYDNFVIIWHKYQNNIATAINKGYIFNLDAFNSLDKGGQNGMVEILRQFMETGIGFSKMTDAKGTRQQNNQLPVQELNGGMGSAVTDFFTQLKLNLSLIENLTGINPLSLGTVDPNAPVRTNEIAVQATSDTLRPILSGWLNVKEGYAKNVVLTIQLLLEFDEDARETYKEIIGERGLQVLKLAVGNATKYGIAIEAMPTDQEKRDLMESAKIALQSGRNGQPGITDADYFAVTSILSSGGSLKLAEMWLESSRRKNLKLAQEQAQANSTQQAQVSAQATQMAEQMKTEGALAIIKQKGIEDRETLVTGAYLTALAAGDSAQADMQIKLIDNYIKTGNLLTPEAMTQQNPQPQPPIQDTGQNPTPQEQMQPQMQ